jgi:hypothetical protein
LVNGIIQQCVDEKTYDKKVLSSLASQQQEKRMLNSARKKTTVKETKPKDSLMKSLGSKILRAEFKKTNTLVFKTKKLPNQIGA